MIEWQTHCTTDVTGQLPIKRCLPLGPSFTFSQAIFIQESGCLAHPCRLLVLCWQGKSRHGNRLQEEALFKVVVPLAAVSVLKILSGEDSGLCLNLSVLNIYSVAIQHWGCSHWYQISLRVRHILYMTLVTTSNITMAHCALDISHLSVHQISPNQLYRIHWI